jgi:hypothetical protein
MVAINREPYRPEAGGRVGYNHTGNNGNRLMLKVISKFSAGIPSAYAADSSPNSS